MNMDYGHQRYIDNIQNQRHIAVRARKARKNGQKRCFSCSKNGSSGPGSRVNEKKKIKREAALFQQYMTKLEAHAKELRKREDLKC